MFGWIVENESVSLNDEYILLYKFNANDDKGNGNNDNDSEPIIYDWRSDDAYDDQKWIRESFFTLKYPEYADSIIWHGKL